MTRLEVLVTNLAGVAGAWPVSGGVPLAEGAAPADARFALLNSTGHPVPVQTEVLATWRDGGPRWVLLDFLAAPPAGGTERFALVWDGTANPAPERPAQAAAMAVAVGEKLVGLAGGWKVSLIATDAAGRRLVAMPDDDELTGGPLRSTLSLTGDLTDEAGRRWFGFRFRATAYAGGLVRLEPLVLIDADREVMQHLRSLELRLGRPVGCAEVVIGGEPGWRGAGAEGVRLLQVDDQQYRLEGTGETGGRAPGWAVIDDGRPTAVALRDFWQQWPKSLEAGPDGLTIGLLPRFEAGTFAHLEPWHKYQYLFADDTYRLRTGQARRWEIWVGNVDGDELGRWASAPFVAAAEPAQAIATGVWDDIAAAGPDMADYDGWAANLFEAYQNSIAVQRDYGAMNWGDWYGERQVNWGNHEYDTANQLLIQFARTADPRYFLAADAAARHCSEVDVVHAVNDELCALLGGSAAYPPRPGLVHQHTVGHVSGFYEPEQVRQLFVEHGVGDGDRPYLCLDAFNLGHLWTQGLARHYFLTGDPFVRETVELIGGNLARLAEDRVYQFMGHSHCGRTTGWSLLALAGAYEIGFDERYLKAMRLLVDDALAEQDPNCGGWLHELPRGHCYCETRKHVGMAGFITSVLLNGLSRYHLLTGDERLPEAIERGVTFLDRDTWHEEWQDWRYTSCPATGPVRQPGVTIMAHVNAVRIAGNEEHKRVLEVAWAKKFARLREAPPPGPGFGKTYTALMYGCPEAAGLLARNGND